MSKLRLLHVEVGGREIPAVYLDDSLRDASSWCEAWSGNEFSGERMAALRKAAAQLPLLESYDRIGASVKAPSQVVAVGLNYIDHAAETKMDVPDEPICFSKSVHSLSGPNDDILMPAGSEKLDWEVELAIVIGAYTYQATQEEATAAIAGYCLTNDVSERTWQLERQGQWMKGKSAPTFCPTGPWIVPAEDIEDPEAIELTLSVNGRVRQQDVTSSMIFSPAAIVQKLSEYFAFYPGDLILTGTPDGVGLATGEYLEAGDEIVVTGTGLGEQRTRVVVAPSRSDRHEKDAQ